MSAPARRYLGIDIGGTKIAVGLVDAGGTLLARAQAPTPHTGGAAVLEAAALAAEAVGKDEGGVLADIRAVGIGAPGVLDANGTVTSATEILPGWSGTAVREVMAARLGRPVAVDNDVRVMAYGEAVLGAARGVGEVLFVSVGTGIGGAVVRDGALWRGPHATAGELAHLLVPATGVLACGCGRYDHLEAVASGPAIAAAYQRRTGAEPAPLTAVVERMRAGDQAAGASITTAARHLGRALGGLLTAIDADMVVVGGGVARIGPEFLEPLAEALRAEVLPPLRAVPVLAAQLGTDAPVLGAALLARDTAAVTL